MQNEVHIQLTDCRSMLCQGYNEGGILLNPAVEGGVPLDPTVEGGVPLDPAVG